MNAKQAKLLKWGAKKFNLSYKHLKKEFKKLNKEEKEIFIKQAKLQQHIL